MREDDHRKSCAFRLFKNVAELRTQVVADRQDVKGARRAPCSLMFVVFFAFSSSTLLTDGYCHCVIRRRLNDREEPRACKNTLRSLVPGAARFS